MPRRAAIGGIVGPLLFAAAWIVSGAATVGYQPASRAISDLAAISATTRVTMTVGMVALGLGLIVDSWSVRAVAPGRAWVAVLVSGVATLGVAAVPLGWFSDGLHGAFAGVGYVALALAPALAHRALTATGHARSARLSLLCSGACAACLLATVAGPAHGLFQRLGLLIGHAWIVWFAARSLREPEGFLGPSVVAL
jgi:hypothetical membrane protein